MEYMYDATDKTMPHKAMPSSDVILFTASNTATSYLDISKAEFHGHMITIICPRGKGLGHNPVGNSDNRFKERSQNKEA